MNCAWQSFLNILPVWLRRDVDRLGRDKLQELRLRLNQEPELKLGQNSARIQRKITAQDLHYCVNLASRYSPWIAETAKYGYITAPGGHRIGLCGNCGDTAGVITNLSNLTSLCLRVARDFPGIARESAKDTDSVLIIGRPGSGKTTLLRDLIRQRSEKGECICVVDERAEIFPKENGAFSFQVGQNTDVLTGCNKRTGVQMLLRTMGPDVIAIDEITAAEDCKALLHAGWCGVKLIATAHAESKVDLFRRPIYRPVLESKLFDVLIILKPDKSWYAERLLI